MRDGERPHEISKRAPASDWLNARAAYVDDLNKNVEPEGRSLSGSQARHQQARELRHRPYPTVGRKRRINRSEAASTPSQAKGRSGSGNEGTCSSSYSGAVVKSPTNGQADIEVLVLKSKDEVRDGRGSSFTGTGQDLRGVSVDGLAYDRLTPELVGDVDRVDVQDRGYAETNDKGGQLRLALVASGQAIH